MILSADLTQDLTFKQMTLRTVVLMSLTTGQGSKLFIRYMCQRFQPRSVSLFSVKNKSTLSQNTEPAAVIKSPDYVKLCSIKLLHEYWNKTGCTAKEHCVQELGKLSCLAQAVAWNKFGKLAQGHTCCCKQFWDTARALRVWLWGLQLNMVLRAAGGSTDWTCLYYC